MTSIETLKARGLTARLAGSKVRITPRNRITEADRTFIMLHRLELIAELEAGDGKERRMSWKVLRNGKAIATISGEPMTRDEALASATFRWPDAEVQ